MREIKRLKRLAFFSVLGALATRLVWFRAGILFGDPTHRYKFSDLFVLLVARGVDGQKYIHVDARATGHYGEPYELRLRACQ